jgi:hypothetical protein
MRNAIETEEAYKLIRDKSLQIYAESCTHFNASQGSLIAGSHAKVDIRESFSPSLAEEGSRKFKKVLIPLSLRLGKRLQRYSSEHGLLKGSHEEASSHETKKIISKRGSCNNGATKRWLY